MKLPGLPGGPGLWRGAWPPALGVCLAAAVAGGLGGCAASLSVTPLATGQPAVAAYELHGDDPAQLRNEAARLCGGKAVVLRESAGSRGVPLADGAGRLDRWWHAALDTMDPPQREAQLMVRCQANPQRELLMAGYEPAPVTEAAPRRPWWSFLMFWRSAAEAATPSRPTAETTVPYGY